MDHYLVDQNATRAAIRAGWSPVSAKSQASKLLRDPHVRAAIDQARDEEKAHCTFTRERVLQELGKVAGCNLGAFVKAVGNGKKQEIMALADVAARDRAAVSQLSLGKQVKITVKDKVAALRMIAEMEGWLEAYDSGPKRGRPVIRLDPAVSKAGPPE